MKNILRVPALTIGLCMLSICIPSAGAEPAARLKTDTGNLYISGSDLRIDEAVEADLIAAGGRISVEREVGADGALAAGTIEVRAPIRQDLRATGGTINVDQPVGGELVAAGGTVRVSPRSSVAGSAMLAGGNVTLEGRVGKNIRIAAGTITLAGEVAGDAWLAGREIHLRPGTRILGNLSFESPNDLKRDPSAVVMGTVNRLPSHHGRDDQHGARIPALLWFIPLFIVSMLFAGALLFMAFPATLAGVANAIRHQPLRSLLTGLGLVFALPPVAVLLMMTVIGLPVGLALLALYPPLLLLGYLAAAFTLGRRMAEGKGSGSREPPRGVGRQLLWLALALLALCIAALVPFVGWAVSFAALVMGMGGWAVWLQQSRGRDLQSSTLPESV